MKKTCILYIGGGFKIANLGLCLLKIEWYLGGDLESVLKCSLFFFDINLVRTVYMVVWRLSYTWLGVKPHARK